MKNLTWQNPEQLFVAQELINKVKSKCCGIKEYLVYRLYGKPKSLPSNIGKEITEAFRFKRMRQPKNNEGKITFKTFNNTSNYINKVDYEEIKRIDNIIKEFEPFMKRQN